MKIKSSADICPLCEGQMKTEKTTFTAERLEKIVEDARKKHHLVEVTTLGK